MLPLRIFDLFAPAHATDVIEIPTNILAVQIPAIANSAGRGDGATE